MVKSHDGTYQAPGLPGLGVEVVGEQAPVSKYDLSFEFGRTDDGLLVEVEYDTALYLPDTGRRLARSLELLLGQVAAAPETRISALRLLDPREAERLRAAAEPEAVPFPDTTLHEQIDEQIRRTPHEVAVATDTETLTYAEIGAWADRIAALVRAGGSRNDQPVGLLVDRSPAMVAGLLGILKAGGAYLPVETDAPPARITTLLRDSGAAVCLVRPDLADLAASAGVHAVAIPGTPDGLPDPGPVRPWEPAAPGNLAAVYYTSGSTGRPKGVACSHDGWVNRLQWMQRSHGLRPGEAVLQKTTLTFDDSAVEVLWPLLNGGVVALLAPGLHRDPRAIIDAAVRHRVVHLQFVPSMLELFLDTLTPADLTGLAALRSVLSSGEALRPELLRRFRELFGDRVFLENTWGATEVSIDSTRHICRPQDATAPSVPVGVPLDNNTVYVLDDRMAQVPFGVVGEMYIGGVGLARGYLGDPARTAAAFVPHPTRPGERIYRTGDWGRLLPDGTLAYASRRDDQVKIRGVRTELGEVEAAARTHPGVADVAVTVWEPAPGDKRLAMYVVPASGAGPVATALREHLRAALPGYAVPAVITELPKLPLTVSGKVDRRALPAPDPAAVVDERPTDPPRGPTETAVAAIWADVLGVASVGRDEDFFALGGHSLLATRAIGRMRQAFGSSLPLSLLFENPTVSGTARRVEEIILAEIENMTEEQVQHANEH
jgi:amino acid adenylation domain-containing protein